MNGTEFDGMMSKMKAFADNVGDPERILRWSSEAMIKKRLVEPFLQDVLGYGEGSDHLELEFSIRKKNRGKRDSMKRVDYSIMLDNEPVIFIEAKKRGSLIEMDDVFDNEKWYGNQISSVKFFVLTNGIEWRWHKKSKRNLDRNPFLVHDILHPNNDEAEFLDLVCKENTAIKRAVNLAKKASPINRIRKKQIDKDGKKHEVEFFTKKGPKLVEFGYAWKPVIAEHWKIEKNLDNLMVSIIKFLAKEYKGSKGDFYEQLELNLGKVIQQKESSGKKLELGYFLNVGFPNVVTIIQKKHILLRVEKIAMRERTDIVKSGLVDYWFSIY